MHFLGLGEPLVLSIFQEVYADAHRELQSNKHFIVIKDAMRHNRSNTVSITRR